MPTIERFEEEDAPQAESERKPALIFPHPVVPEDLHRNELTRAVHEALAVADTVLMADLAPALRTVMVSAALGVAVSEAQQVITRLKGEAR